MNSNRTLIGRRIVTAWTGILLAGWLALGTAWADPVVHYLTVDGAGNQDGSSWEDASSNVQAALELTDIHEIRMAGGIYDLTVALSWTAGANVTVRGGYDAATGNHDPANQVTILRQTASGERVLLMDELEDCRLEQVTLTGGTYNGNLDGGGIRAINSTVMIVDCVISNNTSQRLGNSNHPFGGGVYVDGGSVTMLRCRVENNRVFTPAYWSNVRGGGIYLAGGVLLVENSRITGNISDAQIRPSTFAYSAGVENAAGSSLTLRNSLIYGNTNISIYSDDNSRYGAGVVLRSGGVIENCTIAGNQMYNEADDGAGLWIDGGTVTNTIVWGNWRGAFQKDIGFGGSANEAGNVFFSCALELTDGVNENLSANPLFLDAAEGDFRLDFASFGIDSGKNAAWMDAAYDLDGNPRLQSARSAPQATVDRGAHEAAPLPDSGDLVGDFTASAISGTDSLEVTFTAYLGGSDTQDVHYAWDFKNTGDFDTEGQEHRQVSYTYGPGMHSVRLVVSKGEASDETIKEALIQILPSIVYVSLSGNGSSGADWQNAYTNMVQMQTALEDPGVAEIRIAQGIYDLVTGLLWDSKSNVVIRGGYEGVGEPGEHDPALWPTVLRQTASGERVLLMDGLMDCRLEQVTLTGGKYSGGNRDGGGIRALNSDVIIADCVISNNTSTRLSTHPLGGGIYVEGGSVAMLRCRVENNRVFITGYSSNVRGGGIYLAGGTLLVENSHIIGNISDAQIRGSTHSYSAGVENAAGSSLTLRSSLIYGNTNIHSNSDGNSRYGAGVVLRSGGVIENCTIAANQMYNEADAGAGLWIQGGTVTNTIVYGNLRGNAPNDIGFDGSASEGNSVFYSCAPELMLAEAPNHNLADDPLFRDAAAGDFRLDFASFGIDSGKNAGWMDAAYDLDGNLRLQSARSAPEATVDRGAYEASPLPDSGDLVGDFTASAISGTDSLEVTFTAYVGGSDTQNVHYAWDFENTGDFDIAGEEHRQVSYTYGPGVHSVRLVVSKGEASDETIKEALIRVSSSIVYVSLDGAGGPGVDWQSAYTHLQAALDVTGVTEIRIAQGIYDLTTALSWRSTSNVVIRGGYEGIGDPGNHDPALWPTVLRQTASGERVLLMDELEDCRLEQVTLTGGTYNGNLDGGGIRAINSDVIIADCVISNNTSRRSGTANHPFGGGVYVHGGSVTMLRCRVENNRVFTPDYTSHVRGGGIYLAGGVLLVENSRISGNISDAQTRGNTYAYGAGVENAAGSSLTLRSSLIYGNTNIHSNSDGNSRYGAGVVLRSGGVIENCTIAGNRMYNEADAGAGLWIQGGTVTNTIVYGNLRGNAPNDIGFDGSATEAGNVFYSCAPELMLTEALNHNLADDPLFRDAAAGDFRLDFASFGIDSGKNADWMNDAYDLDGNPRLQSARSAPEATVDRGAHEAPPLPDSGDLVGDFTASAISGTDSLEVTFTAYVGGSDTQDVHYAWDFENTGDFDVGGEEQRKVTHTYGPGVYSVRLLVSKGEASDETIKEALIRVSSSIVYVCLDGAGGPGVDWQSAYTNLQAALDVPGVKEILIAQGIYDLTTALSWRSTSNVVIRGGYEGIGDPGNHDLDQWPTVLRQTGSGERVLLMDELEDCRLEQVTLTGGTYNGNLDGGGIRAINSDVIIADCVISNNTSRRSGTANHPFGGGVYVHGGSVAILRCRVENNRVFTPDYTSQVRGGGIYLAGGVLLVENSRITGNISDAQTRGSTYSYSAGVENAAGSSLTLRNSLIYGNQNIHSNSDDNSRYGAGVVLRSGGVIESCTIAGNQMYNEADVGAGLWIQGGTVTNTIVWGNLRGAVQNDVGFDGTANEAGNVFYSCASELTLIEVPNHNLPDDPLFLDSTGGDFRLQQGSPAIDAGINQTWMLDATDLAGMTRILMGTVDMGCYETPPPRGSLFMFR